VNHQVENNVDIQRAGGELSYAMDFEVNGVANVWAQRDKRRIKSLQVSDLQKRPSLFGGPNHLVGFIERARDWFLYQHVYSIFEKRTGNLGMRLRWHNQADGVHFPYQITPVSGPFDASLGSDLARRGFVQVANQLEVSKTFSRQRSMNAGVLFSQVAYTDYGGS
jgi:hypothetical protein